MTLRPSYPGLRYTHGPETAVFHVLLTVAELKTEMSKDWIRPPTRSQEYRFELIYYRSLLGYKPR